MYRDWSEVLKSHDSEECSKVLKKMRVIEEEIENGEISPPSESQNEEDVDDVELNSQELEMLESGKVTFHIDCIDFSNIYRK